MIKRGDFVKYENATFLIVEIDGKLEMWDFQAWLKGYYDAYVPLDEQQIREFQPIGNLKNNPEMLPAECEGYNGEPNAIKIETVWENPKYK